MNNLRISTLHDIKIGEKTVSLYCLQYFVKLYFNFLTVKSGTKNYLFTN